MKEGDVLYDIAADLYTILPDEAKEARPDVLEEKNRFAWFMMSTSMISYKHMMMSHMTR